MKGTADDVLKPDVINKLRLRGVTEGIPEVETRNLKLIKSNERLSCYHTYHPIFEFLEKKQCFHGRS